MIYYAAIVFIIVAIPNYLIGLWMGVRKERKAWEGRVETVTVDKVVTAMRLHSTKDTQELTRQTRIEMMQSAQNQLWKYVTVENNRQSNGDVKLRISITAVKKKSSL